MDTKKDTGREFPKRLIVWHCLDGLRAADPGIDPSFHYEGVEYARWDTRLAEIARLKAALEEIRDEPHNLNDRWQQWARARAREALSEAPGGGGEHG